MYFDCKEINSLIFICIFEARSVSLKTSKANEKTVFLVLSTLYKTPLSNKRHSPINAPFKTIKFDKRGRVQLST